jgi:hypothetical protein
MMEGKGSISTGRVWFSRSIRIKAIALAICFVAVLSLNSGCSKTNESDFKVMTTLSELNDLCFGSSTNCERLQAVLVLYLDTVNLPSGNIGIQKLVLSSRPTTPIASGNDRIEFFFEGSKLPEEIDPGIRDETGWKVRISSAGLEYCDTCFNESGLVDVIVLRGSLDNVEFIYDPGDEIEVFIVTRRGIGQWY